MNLPSIEPSSAQTVPPVAQTTTAQGPESSNTTVKGDGNGTAADFQVLMASLQSRLGTMHSADSLKSTSTTATHDPASIQDPGSETLSLPGEEIIADGAVASEEKTRPVKSAEAAAPDGLSLPFVGTLLPPTTSRLPTTGTAATALGAELQTDQNEMDAITDPAALPPLQRGQAQSVQSARSNLLSSETSENESEQQFMDELKNLLAMMPGGRHDDSTLSRDTQAVTSLAQSAGFASPDGAVSPTGTVMTTAMTPTSLHNMANNGTEPSPSRFWMEQPLNLEGDAWADRFAERILWASKNQLHYAEIQLDPPELGALQVRIQVHQDQAQVQFVSPHHQVREAIESSLDRLRDLFQQQGMQLSHSQVADGGGRGNAQQESRREGWRPLTAENPIATEESMLQPRALREGALIDRYA